MKTIIRLGFFLAMWLLATAHAQPWMDVNKTIDERTSRLLAEMTLQEKVAMMHGVCRFEIPGCGFTIGKIPANERLGIPALHMTDGPAGVRNGQPATSFPAPVAIAASWNTELAYEVAAAIGLETLARGQDVLLSPMINVVRVPLAGRNFETFGEDPHLLSRMAVAHIRGVQDQGVMANAKHYILNNQEWDRRRVTVTVGERALREIYLPAFEAAVTEANVASIMCSYNREDGTHVCHNKRLLSDLLRGEVGFRGFVVTDWNALRDSDATPMSAIAAGLNVVMPWPKGDVYGPPFEDGKPQPDPDGSLPPIPLVQAVQAGDVDEADVDALVADVLRTMFRFGVFEREDGPLGDLPFERHRKISRRAAEQGAVLLKNKDEALPLRADDTVAVIGDRAFRGTTGGGGSSAVHSYYDPVAPLEAIRASAPAMRVHATRGIDELPGSAAIRESAWTQSAGPGGVRAEYFDNDALDGDPALTRAEPRIAFDWSRFAPQAAIPVNGWSARFTGIMTPPVSGEYVIELVRSGAARAWLDGEPLFSAASWQHGGLETFTSQVELEAGRPYSVVVEYRDINQRHALVKLGWTVPGLDVREEMVADAAAAAAKSNVAVVFVGDPASEGRDRPGLSLGEGANRLISSVAAANPRTVVVLSAGAPIAMPWIDEVAAVLLAWYPGQEDGRAVANLLTGASNPSGKLPVTFGRQLQDYPANTPEQYPGIAPADAPDETWRESVYSEGVFVGYRHFERAGIEPLFPFGHGLSYTTFDWQDAHVEADGQGGWNASLVIENTGSRAGAEVVQLYVAPPGRAAPRPPKELRAFARVELAAGESKRVSLNVPGDALRYWNKEESSWATESGVHEILLGASSSDIRHRLPFDVAN
jgi:beta-glucosidase